MLRFIGWWLKWSLATAFFLAVMAGVGYLVFVRAAEGGDYVTIPNVANRSLSEAYEEILRHGLQVGKTEEKLTDSVPANSVIAQRPPAGRVVRAGRRVDLTVSVGPDLEETPSLIGQTLRDVQTAIASKGLFTITTPVARMPHSSPPDLVIGQDPPPGKRLPRGGSIALLVSTGTGTARSFPMRDIIGMKYQDALRVLNELGLAPKPILVRRPDAPTDIVLDQEPPANTLVSQGTEVRFRLRSSAQIPGAWREATITYTVPRTLFKKEVRIVAIGKDGRPFQLFPRPEDYEDGSPPKYDTGTRITQPLFYEDQVSVEIYLDGAKVQSYYFEGDAEPVVTNHDIEGENARAAP